MTSIQGARIRSAAPKVLLTLLVGLAMTACGGGDGGPAPMVSLAVQPAAVVLGQSATLTWTSNDGNSCAASGGWSGSEPSSGTQTVTPTATGSVTYTLTCSGSAYSGSASQSATLAVAAASAFSATTLVANQAGSGALTTDANLVNAWGIAFGPTSPVWVANNHTQTSTLYDGNGKPQPFAAPRVVGLAPGAGGAGFDATGIVYNATTDFVVSSGAKSAAAPFIFDGEGGMIAGWAPSVDPTQSIVMYADPDGAVYKGLAIANNGSANFLYAADFHNNKIDVFDASYRKQTPSAARFAFKDPTLPAGYAPFGIQAIKNGPDGSTQIYVAYAKQAPPDNKDDASGPGLGLLDVFDANGNLVTHLIAAGGRLDAPWGMALAPADFGTLGGALLVGNFGDGKINGFNASTGAYIGTVGNAAGTAFAMPGLWGIAFGNGAGNQPRNTLFFAAGPNDETSGAYGRIDLGATAPALNVPPVVTLSAPAGNLTGTVTLNASVQAQVNVARVEYFANGTTSLGVATTAPYGAPWDTTKFANGTVTVKAVATDVDAHVGSSSELTVTVANGTAVTVTLAQLQAQVFTPACSGCHNGSAPPNGALPGSQNLTAGNSLASLVNVASLEKPAVMRVRPGDPANSYLIQKLEGAIGIAGSRMPLGGPFLDPATIDQIKSWIASGAPDN